jgi:hypothetical protein
MWGGMPMDKGDDAEDFEPEHEEMDPDEAEQLIGDIFRGDKLLERSWHFWDDPEQRRFTVPEVLRICRRHTMSSIPEWNADLGNFKVELDGFLAGLPVRVVLGLRRVGPCSLITIYRIRTRRKKK